MTNCINNVNGNYCEILKTTVSNGTCKYCLEKFNCIPSEEFIAGVKLHKKPCIHRGKLIYQKSCKCANGRIWECDIIGQVNESLCNKVKCKEYIEKE